MSQTEPVRRIVALQSTTRFADPSRRLNRGRVVAKLPGGQKKCHATRGSGTKAGPCARACDTVKEIAAASGMARFLREPSQDQLLCDKAIGRIIRGEELTKAGIRIRPLDWLKVIPFQTVAASDRLWTDASSGLANFEIDPLTK